ncbi:MAG: hypothetical protein AAGF56_07695 [Pseudomonadota bacterium]
MAQNAKSDLARDAEGLTGGEGLAVAAAVAWVVGAGLYFGAVPSLAGGAEASERSGQVVMLVAIALPAFVVWVAIAMARANRRMREDVYRLSSAIDALRKKQEVIANQQAMTPSAQQDANRMVPSPQKTEAPASNFRTRREVSRLIVPRAAPQQPGDQPALALVGAVDPDQPPLEQNDLIQALNFPNDEHDTEGFAALRRALQDRTARRLVQASQDVLTLLSQDGIYMDDMRPEPIPADLWRRFAAGERGKAVSPLGAIRDRDALARTSARMREDTIFRDAVHHFLRRFDTMLLTFQHEATDTDLLELAETRTARAFMLLARSAGAFD